MTKRVVITGLGCISPVGNDFPTTWEHIRLGQSGAGPITHYDSSEFDCRIAAEVKGFDGAALFGNREARRMDRCTQFALAAALEAVRQAGLEVNDSEPRPDRRHHWLRDRRDWHDVGAISGLHESRSPACQPIYGAHDAARYSGRDHSHSPRCARDQLCSCHSLRLRYQRGRRGV